MSKILINKEVNDYLPIMFELLVSRSSGFLRLYTAVGNE